MSMRRHLLSVLTLAALLIGPFAVAPQPAQAATLTFLVDKLGDVVTGGTTCSPITPNDCSLRDAINKANLPATNNDTKEISFELVTTGQIGGAPPYKITLSSILGALPPITADNVQIEADTLFGAPQVEIDGNGLAVGLQLQGDAGLVKGLSFYGFTNFGIEPFFGSAIYITGSGNKVETSYIGIASDGTVPANKANFSGIRIDGAAANGNTVGGPGGSAVANYIAGNQQNGVIVRNASGNFIQNNIIGLARSGNSLIPRANGQYGVQVTIFGNGGTSANNTIGGASTSLANIIGANGQAGVLIRGSGVTSTTLLANYIGADKNTDTDLGNAGDGVVIEAGAFNTDLGGSLSAPLVISGNSGYGVVVRAGDGAAPDDTTISGVVYIGTNRGGLTALANDAGGIYIGSASDTLIDGTAGSVRVSGNGGVGITVTRGSQPSNLPTSNTSIVGALIGVTPQGSGADLDTNRVPNDDGGVLIADGSIGTSLSGNTVSGNGAFGIRLSEALTTTIQANYVGLDLASTGVISNSGPGIAVYSSTNTLIGGVGDSFTNYIGGNAGPGVVISGTGTLSSTVAGNIIGLALNDATDQYTARAANAGEGVLVEGGPRETRVDSNTVGASADTTASDFAAVRIAGTATTTVTVSLNQIGWQPGATSAAPPIQLPNGDGVSVSGARAVDVLSNTIRFGTGSGLLIGEASAVRMISNTILSNLGNGVTIDDSSTVDVLSSTIRLNGGDGVRVTDSLTVSIRLNNAANGGGISDNTLRGVFVGLGSRVVDIVDNLFRGNDAEAVRVEDSATRRVRIRSNQMTGNGGAIALDGASPYDGTPPDTAAPGPNRDIDPPFGLRVSQSGQISGFVYTSTNKIESLISPVSACVTCTIQVFAPNPELAAGDGQGWQLLSVEQGGATLDEIIQFAPNGGFVAQLSGPVPDQLLLTATDGYGNTSEFAVFDAEAGLELSPLSPAPPAQSAAPSATVTYTMRLTNTGTLDLNNLTLETGGTLDDWVVTEQPDGVFGLSAGASRDLTVTLRLPSGANPNVRVPKVDTTAVTVTSPGLVSDTLSLVTTVLERPVLRVSPTSGQGTGKPDERVTYSHTLFNDGNLTVTVQLQARTIDPADSGKIWVTNLSTDTITLGPGASRSVSVNVNVPAGAQETDALGNPVRATTVITATTLNWPDQTRVFSDVTRVALRTAAEMGTDETQPGAAGEEVTFFHTITNTSNGQATFKLNYDANFDSTVTFVSDTPGVVINPNTNTFTLDNVLEPPARNNQLRVKVIVRLDERLLPGETEIINIFLTDAINNQSIGGAAVVDRVNITRGLLRPRLWLPYLAN